MSVPVQDSLPDRRTGRRPARWSRSGPSSPTACGRTRTPAGWQGPPTYSGGLLRSAPDRTDLRASGYERRSNTSRAERTLSSRTLWWWSRGYGRPGGAEHAGPGGRGACRCGLPMLAVWDRRCAAWTLTG